MNLFKNTIMKKYYFTPVLVILFAAAMTVRAQDYQEEYLGLPGDNLNLYAVMKLFQESETLEGFERKMNDENSRINNLDLNGDGYVDYIRVIDNVDRNVHYIVLQVAVNARESQDVAVFTVVKQSDGAVEVQLIGDEALYGKNYIIEPFVDGETPNPGYGRAVGREKVVVTRTSYVEIASWPLINFMFMPGYVVWHSPWYYNYYPSYWRSWNPFGWHYYYGYHYHYHPYYYGHYRHYDHYRHADYHTYYYSGRRTNSGYVSNRINEGSYRTTYAHPEQRREGSAAYYRTNPDRKAGSSGSTAGGSSARRAATGSKSSREAVTTTPERRTSSTGTTRKPVTTSTERRGTNSGTVRQSTPSETSRKSSGAVNSGKRSSTTPQASQSKGSSTRSSGGSVSGSGRRSSGSSKPAGTSQQSKRTTESKSTRDSGRR
jgi:hypothetical protein